MTLNFFSKHSSSSEDGKRYDAVNCVAMWLAGKGHLPKDLMRSLHYLIPELQKDTAAREFED